MLRIRTASFVIAVHDLDTSTAFYRDVLGFEVEPVFDEGWRAYSSGAYRIMAGRCPESMHPSKLGDHSYFAYFEIEGIDKYYDKVRAAGAKVSKPIDDVPWGMREFGVVTTDGHRIMFGEPLKEAG
jgi:predicted enzyme related to lactoylglutathione lyase